jgi:hypothetical protein
MARAEWKVLPHKPIQKLTENLWTVTGALPNMPMERVLSIARMGDGRLVLHNGIALEEPLMQEIEAFGEPAFLLVPNGYHRMDAPAFKKRYPMMKVLCPEGVRKKVEEVVEVDGTYADLPADERVSLRYLDGVAKREGYLEVRSESGTSLVFNDVMFNMPHLPGLQGLVLRIVGSTGGPKVTRVGKLFLVTDRAALRAQLLTLADTPKLARVVVMHGDTVTDDPAGMLRKVAATL